MKTDHAPPVLTVDARATPPRAGGVHPRFAGTSFWNYRTTCALMGARYSAAPLGLITVAALLPPGWKIRLVDRNVQEVDDDDLAWAGVVMTGGGVPQPNDVLSLIKAAHARGKPFALAA